MIGIGRFVNSRATEIFRYLACALLFCIICGLVLSIVSGDSDGKAGDRFSVDGVSYMITEQKTDHFALVEIYEVELWVTEYNKSHLFSYDGVTYEITAIGYGAFFAHTALTSVTIPDGVTKIGFGAFKNCTSLKEAVIPDSVTELHEEAFYGCSKLRYLTIPISLDASDAVGVSYDEAFVGCENLVEVTFTKGSGKGCDYSKSGVKDTPWYLSKKLLTTVVFSEGIEYIGKYTLYGCDRVISITVADSVSSIGKYAFKECRMVWELTLPITLNAVTDNDKPVFASCTSLQKITFTKGTDGYGFNYGISGDDSDTNYYGYTPWYLSKDTLRSIVFKEGITHIGRYAFMTCKSINSVTFATSLKDIDAFAFCGCDSLKSIKLPNGLNCIGDSSFFGCTALKSLVIPKGVNYIGQYAFYGCSSLKAAVPLANVEYIGQYAFYGCPIEEPVGVSPTGGNVPGSCPNTSHMYTSCVRS